VKEVIYLIANQYKVERITKNPPSLNRGELPIKVTVDIDKSAFGKPTIEREIVVSSPWEDDVVLSDIELRKDFITEDEASEIKEKRAARMKEILESQGYEIIKKEGK
jgi:hypothetical protein